MTVNQEKKREGWVDIAKGIAITAVVFGHMTITGLNHDLFPVQTLFAVLWHVSVFFLIGGFFIKEEKLVGPFGFIKGKVKSLYLLILYIYIPVLLLHNFFLNIGFYDVSIEYYGKYVTYWGIKDLLINTIQAVCFAGREPLLGAMWFVYVLFMALCIFSVLSWGTKKVTSEEKHYEALRFGVIFLLAVISSTMTEVLHVNIPRCNNVFTAVLLIYVGMKAYQKYHLRFDNVFIALLCAIIVWHIGTTKGYVSLVENKMPNVVSMLASSSAALYVVCFFSRKLDTVKWGGVFCAIGKESFYIMGLHFIGFKICTIILNVFGMDMNLAQLTAPIGDKYFLILPYLVCGVVVPIVVICLFRFAKNKLIRVIEVIKNR